MIKGSTTMSNTITLDTAADSHVNEDIEITNELLQDYRTLSQRLDETLMKIRKRKNSSTKK